MLNIINLGSTGDLNFLLHPAIKHSSVLVEMDAIGRSEMQEKKKREYFKYISLKRVISDVVGEADFYENTFIGSSSLMKPEPYKVLKYGVKPYYTLKEKHTVCTTTINDICTDYHLNYIDFLKTDLEGMDHYILQSIQDIKSVGMIQCEIRFDTMYKGEIEGIETLKWLKDKGFEIITLTPENWKYDVVGRRTQKKGRTIFCDVLLRNTNYNTLFQKYSQLLVFKMLRLENIYKGFLQYEFDNIAIVEGMEEFLDYEESLPIQNRILNFRKHFRGVEMWLKGLIDKSTHVALE